ncbi:hypothetical protein KDA_04980 [Dictyobacter alpinus]|uniref:Phosphatidic acid phosphatase type 2/haloperoxidase domain-containing protein n=1 Tax=Dictyobacter alpinus TaxID=2014873 RepID=A0A402B0Y5_9CHLR|nr:phosphatase PAP2 family protein [Dictyobacter alpinus]GCE25014.1 hypothetical protein KDA_04980 [Dictyobacter alpinus]
MQINRATRATAFPWFIAASVLVLLLIAYTVVYATGMLSHSTLEIERWLLWRPITRFDCSVFEWRRLGEAPVTLCMLIILGLICIRMGHRKRVLVFFLLLLGISLGLEVGGKMLFDQYMPYSLRSGMTVLTCPQMAGQPASVQLAAGAGLLGQVPDPPRKQVSWAHDVAQMPIDYNKLQDSENSFPGGHATRWCLSGLILAWITRRYLRPRWLAIPLSLLFAIGSLLGGFMQFYIGVHFITDTISGYLLGSALACCGIGVLILYDKKRTSKQNLPLAAYPTRNAMSSLPQNPSSYSDTFRA